jgi:peroxin-5
MDLATCLSTNLEHTQFPSVNLEKTMEDFDWEALFASLDTTTRAKDEHADPLSSTSPDSSIAPGLVDDETACSTTESTHQLPDSVSRINLLSDSSDAFERGMRIVRHDDNLSLAVLAFEEACRAEPMRFEAWKMLGSVLAEVEREAEAILAFKEALKFDPNNLDVLMRLAVSYTNEGSHDLACQCLEQWMRIKYPQISIPELDSQEVLLSHSELFERIKGSFIQAARLSLGDENIDPDVQVGLGVLMFSAELYQMAADCFYAAIQSTELDSIKYQTQQHLLWNRYAACLGNIREKEDMAIQAYETALALKPNFVKARCNLGVLYHNINQPLMGAKNILEALMWNRTAESIAINRASDSDQATQETIDYDDTTEMYETLMKCCSSMCRWDLAELVGQNMDLQSFKIQLEGCGQ